MVPARWILCACGVVAYFSPNLAAAPRLAAIFGDQMVLQQGRAVSIWGWADAGEKIQVGFAGQEKETEAGDDGNWSVTLEPLEASFQERDLVVEGAGETTCLSCHDIHGQSTEKHQEMDDQALCFVCHTRAGPRSEVRTYRRHSTRCGY